MRITLLTPGTGHFYCGNCLREDTLARALKKLGHDVTMIPLYLPMYTEEAFPHPSQPVFMGGINLYLQHKLPLLRVIPPFLTRLLDSPALLRWSSKQGDMTDAAKHADLTLSMLRCDESGQRAELMRMMRWMKKHDPPDIISLCNVLLTGLAGPIKEILDVPVIANMQGEDSFLDALPEPIRTEAWDQLRINAGKIDAFIPVSRYYADRMRERLDLDAAQLHVVHNGIEHHDMQPPDAVSDQAAPPIIGYLARMCAEKGLPTLIDAFIELSRRGTVPDVQLRIAGVMLKVDRPLVRELESRLRRAGCLDRVTFLPNISRANKIEFLRSLDVLSVPATYGESFGLYVIEAMACGVPVVQPRHGAFPEILERSRGGLLCEPDDVSSLATELERILNDRELAKKLSMQGRNAVLDHFNAERMAREVADVYHQAVQRNTPQAESTPASSPA